MNKKTDTIGKRFMEKYPDKIPIIIQYDKEIKFSKINNGLGKFLVPNDITIGKLLLVIRTNASISHTESLSVLINNTAPKISDTIGIVYSKYKNINDDCLHINITKEKTFGV